MANARRNQEHLGIDTNVLVAYLDKDHPAHSEAGVLIGRGVCIGPTILHEAYHTLVFKMKWDPGEASRTLIEVSTEDENRFVNQTQRTTRMGLRLAAEHGLGGRDALILAGLLSSGVKSLVTLDGELLALGSIRYGRASLSIATPKSLRH